MGCLSGWDLVRPGRPRILPEYRVVYSRVSPALWERLHYHAFNKRKSIRSVVRDLLESYHQQERAREQTRPTTGSSTGKEEQ